MKGLGIDIHFKPMLRLIPVWLLYKGEDKVKFDFAFSWLFITIEIYKTK